MKHARTYIETSTRVMLIAASIIIVCLVCGFGFYVQREGKNTAGKAAGEFMAFASEYQDVDLQLYDGIDISGAELVRLIESIDDTRYLAVVVNTKKKTPGTSYNKVYNSSDNKLDTSSSPSNISTTQGNKSNGEYINPTATFRGQVHRDNNDVIICLEFTQQ